MITTENEQKCLAERNHWDASYKRNIVEIRAGWKPVSYDARCLEYMLLSEIDSCHPLTVLEVGCGNSEWLPYLAKSRNLNVFGIDYSEAGCELAKQRLVAEGVSGEIYCHDLFVADPELIGQYDFVYSLGVVEHFSNTDKTIRQLLKFVKPGGTLLTEVPNLHSIHGILSYIYQPELLKMHKITKIKDLVNSYKNNEMVEIHCNYLGMFSVDIVAWKTYQRFAALDKLIMPLILIVKKITNFFLSSSVKYDGISSFSPFLYVSGKKLR